MSTNYVCEPKNVLGIPNNLALRIAEQAGIQIDRDDRARIEKKSTSSPAAYDCYLRARYEPRGLVTNAAVPRMSPIQLLQQAVNLDDRFAAAYAALAREY